MRSENNRKEHRPPNMNENTNRRRRDKRKNTEHTHARAFCTYELISEHEDGLEGEFAIAELREEEKKASRHVSIGTHAS